jgi:hypothetical protein
MSFESTFNSSFNDDIDQWAKLIINNHVVNWDKYIGLEVICYPSVEGDFDLELDDDDDDTVVGQYQFRLQMERNSMVRRGRLPSLLILQILLSLLFLSSLPMLSLFCESEDRRPF